MEHSSDLLASISQKLQISNQTIIQQKNYQKALAEAQLIQLQRLIIIKKKNQEDMLYKTRQYLENVINLSNQNFKDFKLKGDKQRQSINCMKQQIQNLIEEKDRQHQNNLEEITDKVQQEMNCWMIQCIKKSKQQSEKIEGGLSNLSKKVIKLQKQLKLQSQIRIQNCNKITNGIEQQINRFKECIQVERQKCIIAERNVYEMIQTLNQKLNEQIQTTAIKRKKNNQSLLRLLELACDKLEEKQIKRQ